MVHRKQVLILESEKLLAAGIVSLLASRADLDVAQTTVSSLSSLAESDCLQPEVIILEEALLAENISAVVKMADRQPKLRLIVFRLSDDKVQVFDKQMMQVGQVSDFLELI